MGNWFEVSKDGLAKIVRRKGVAFALFELIQNAIDEDGVTRVDVTLAPIPGKPSCDLVVADDAPNGFRDLSHSFTLFAESSKKSDPGKRGRFNLGEKLVLAICRNAQIRTTTGSVFFSEDGRTRSSSGKTQAGSVFIGEIRMTREEMDDAISKALLLIPPKDVIVTLNGEPIKHRTPVATTTASLMTEVANDEGVLCRRILKTEVQFFRPWIHEKGMIYEMGIPIVETGDHYHYNVMQKVPLSIDRDNVPPGYLRDLREICLDATRDIVPKEASTQPWVRSALESPNVSSESVRKMIEHRFGENVVSYDPSDPEANKLAVSKGYVVVHGGQLSSAEWENVRRANAIRPAGKVTPSPKPFSEDGKPLRLIDEMEWDWPMREAAMYFRRAANAAIKRDIVVQFAYDRAWPFSGCYGDGVLTVNLGRLGKNWCEENNVKSGSGTASLDAFMIHEFAHEFSKDHLSSEYHDALCRVGAELMKWASRGKQ